ncbi:hypothetical protein IMSAGC022_00236 [Alistipes sp.]|nr:hypothetical protein IMSAGC022_00236 [Alistipes sp.]
MAFIARRGVGAQQPFIYNSRNYMAFIARTATIRRIRIYNSRNYMAFIAFHAQDHGARGIYNSRNYMAFIAMRDGAQRILPSTIVEIIWLL